MGGNKEAPSLLLKTYIVSVFVHSFFCLFVCFQICSFYFMSVGLHVSGGLVETRKGWNWNYRPS